MHSIYISINTQINILFRIYKHIYTLSITHIHVYILTGDPNETILAEYHVKVVHCAGPLRRHTHHREGDVVLRQPGDGVRGYLQEHPVLQLPVLKTAGVYGHDAARVPVGVVADVLHLRADTVPYSQ